MQDSWSGTKTIPRRRRRRRRWRRRGEAQRRVTSPIPSLKRVRTNQSELIKKSWFN